MRCCAQPSPPSVSSVQCRARCRRLVACAAHCCRITCSCTHRLSQLRQSPAPGRHRDSSVLATGSIRRDVGSTAHCSKDLRQLLLGRAAPPPQPTTPLRLLGAAAAPAQVLTARRPQACTAPAEISHGHSAAQSAGGDQVEHQATVGVGSSRIQAGGRSSRAGGDCCSPPAPAVSQQPA